MAFRLAVIAAGSCSSAEDAKNLVASMRKTPKGRTPAAVVQVLGALESSGVGDFTVGRRTDSRGALLSVPHPEAGVLEALLILAKDHDLAVYDIALNRLYDPAGGLQVDVSLPGVRIPFLTRELLCDLVLRPEWPDSEAPYVILDRAKQDFIQVWRDEDGHQVEYREFDAAFHYMCMVDDSAVVIDVMWAWATGDDSWRGALAWEFLDLDKPRSVTLRDESSDDGSRLRLGATLKADGSLQISGEDDRPGTSAFDAAYEWYYDIASEHVDDLVIALGGKPGGDIIDLLAAGYSGESVSKLDTAIHASGVPYHFYSWP